MTTPTTAPAGRTPAPAATAAPAAGRAVVRLTVVDRRRTATPCDVLVDAPAGTTLGSARPALDAATGLAAGVPLTVAGLPLRDDTVVGQPPLLDGAVLVAGPAPAVPPPAPLLEVHVVAGPDAGRRVALAPGTWVVGRGPDATVRVEDADTSRAHAVVTVAAGRVVVADLGSTNGTGLAAPGEPPTPLPDDGPAPWDDGTHLVVGASRLALRSPGGAGPAAAVADGRGHLLVNRAPRVRADVPPPTIRFPDPPPPLRPVRLPWPALVIPAVLAVPMALLWHQPAFLLLALLTPLALLGQYLVERRGGRKQARAAAAEYAADVERAEAELAAALRADAGRLELAHPDLGLLTATAAGPGRRLWERAVDADDALVVRLGLGPVMADVRVEGPRPPTAPAAEHPAAPVTVDLLATRVLGLAGAGEPLIGLARAVIAQLATLHTPYELRLVVRASRPDRRRAWLWADWLPHLDGGTDLDALGADPGPPGAAGAAGGPVVTVVVLDGAHDLRRDPTVADLLRRAATAERNTPAGSGPPPQRVVVLCLDDDATRLPAECRATVVVGPALPEAAGAGAVLRADGQVRHLEPDALGPGPAAGLARDLARLRDATPRPAAAAVPSTLTLPEVAGLPAAPSHWGAALADRWQRDERTPPPLRITLGHGPGGPWTVDLRTDGPHALVAGTTGAGKSELLRTLVAALAIAHPPTEVAVLLVDYKGGTAFAGLEALPHVCGLLTDLDGHSARRTLTALRAELRRRERVLRSVGAADLDAFDRLAGADRAGAAPIPRLVVVVDEFRVLAEELPDLLGGLVRVAAVGRSLGVHLVLATQRPGGVVTADMRANLNLRVSLRVRDRTDSEDVVEAPDAAALPASAPGRAVVRAGSCALRTVQTALLTVPAAGDDGAVRVQVIGDGAVGRGAPASAPGPAPQSRSRQGADAVDALAAACREAVLVTGAVAPTPPWLPPLPDVVLLDEVGAVPPCPAGAVRRPVGQLVLGLADLPDEQRREALTWDLDHGHLAVVGGPRSGRTTAVRAVLAELLRLGRAAHVHILSGPGGGPGGALVPGPGGRRRGTLPGLGTVVTVDDADRAARLLRHLATDPVRARWTVLVVDGWEAVAEVLRSHDRGRPFDDLVALARDRGGDGLRLVAAGGRSLLTGAIGAVLPTRLLLRTADPTDLLVAGLGPHELPAVMPPGRALRLGTGRDGSRSVVEAQVALLVADPAPAAQEAALLALVDSPAQRADADACPGPGPGVGVGVGLGPLRLVPLPTAVDLSDLTDLTDLTDLLDDAEPAPDAKVDQSAVVVGLGGDDASPVRLPLPAGEVVLVAGPAGSGRTTALRTVAAQAARSGRTVVHAEPRGLALLRGPAGAVPVAGADSGAGPDAGADSGAGPGVGAGPRVEPPPAAGTVVIVDDLDRLPSHVQDEVEALVAAGAAAVVAATAADAVIAFRGLLAAARRTRCGLLLGSCAPGEAEVLGVREGLPRSTVPGRGVVVARGRPTPVQVARADGRARLAE